MRKKIVRAVAAALIAGTLAMVATAPYGAPGTRGPSSLSIEQ